MEEDDEADTSKSSYEEIPLGDINLWDVISSLETDLAIRCISMALLIRRKPEPRGGKPFNAKWPAAEGFLKTLASYSS